MNSPELSIVLPVYNGERYLKDSIQSVIDQEFENWELIVVDDCSTDKSAAIVKQFQKYEPRIKLISNQENKKLPATLNVGFAHAKGNFLSWTSDDNMYLKSAFREMMGAFDSRPDIGLVYSDYSMIDENSRFLKTMRSDSPAEVLLGNTVGACFVYRKSAAKKAGEYRTDLFLGEDFEYWIRLSQVAKFHHLSMDLYRKRSHSQNLSISRRSDIRRVQIRIFEEYKELIAQQPATLKSKIYCKWWANDWKNPSHLSYLAEAFFNSPTYTVQFPFLWAKNKLSQQTRSTQ